MRGGAFAGARVLLVGGYPPPHGGIAIHVAALREELAQRGARVEVLDVGGRPRKAPGVTPATGPASLGSALVWRAAAGFLVHVHISGHTPKSWLVALACALVRRPFGPSPLLTVHSGLLASFLALGARRRALVRSVAGAFARVVAVSPHIADHLARAGISRARLCVAPAFTGAAKPGRPPLGLEALRAERRPLLTCSVAQSPIYGLRVLLAALPALARRLPRVGLAVFGQEDAERVRALARRYRVEDRVEYLGPLEHAQALAVIAASDAFVRPALADGDAISVREALALGVPVVASAVGTRPEGVLLFRNGDSLDLAAQLCARLASPRGKASSAASGLEPLLQIYREQLGGALARPAALEGRREGPCAASSGG